MSESQQGNTIVEPQKQNNTVQVQPEKIEQACLILEDLKTVPQAEKINESKNQSPPSPQNDRFENTDAVLSQQSASKSNSPSVVSKSKLQTVKKLLGSQQQKLREVQAKAITLQIKKEELKQHLNEKLQRQKNYNLAIEQNQKISQKIKQLNATFSQYSIEHESVKSKTVQLHEQHAKQLQSLNSQKLQYQHQLEQKRKAELTKKHEKQADLHKVKEQIAVEQEKINNLRSQYQKNLKRKDEIESKINHLSGQKAKAQEELNISEQSHAAQAQRNASAKEQQLKKITELKQKINLKKQELNQAKNQSNDNLKLASEKINQQIKNAKTHNSELAQTNKKLEEQINQKSKQAGESKQSEKKKEKKIIDLTKKSQDLVRKVNELKEESAKLDAQKDEKKPIVKHEEKIPEQLLAAQSKNQALKKQIKRTIQRYEQEKNQMDKLVPPSVIENMNQKISKIISNNERIIEIHKVASEVTAENEKLAQEKERLEWGQNNHLKELQIQRKNQQEKNKVLEQYLQRCKKSLQQTNSKLEEYVKQYPNFNPDKKKKVEQPQSQAKGKNDKNKKVNNEKSPTANQVKPDNKKKKEDVVIEQVKPEEGKGKNKKKKGNAPEIVETKIQEVKIERNREQVVEIIQPEIKVQTKQAEQAKKKKKK